jgi:peptide chain release factor 1
MTEISDKLNSIKKRYEELERLLVDLKVISDKALYQKYAKELSGIQPVINKYKECEKICQDIEDMEKLLKKKEDTEEFLQLIKEELSNLNKKKVESKNQLDELLLGEDGEASKDIIVEIRAGTGGSEASLFVADLYRMYTKYANRHNWKVEIMNAHHTQVGGLKEVIFSIKGKDVYKKFRYESGVHRVQRIPITEASGRIHTSAATVAVLPEPKETELTVNPKDLKIDVFRSSGPGGQSVNTADSAVRITHIPTSMVVTCQDERSQLKNKIKAMRVLRARLLDKIRQEKEAKVSQERRLQIGTGDRSEKIRTYNFPDRRITDHRIGLTLHKLEDILEGNLDDLITALISALSTDKHRLKNTDGRRY